MRKLIATLPANATAAPTTEQTHRVVVLGYGDYTFRSPPGTPNGRA
jgi:hypothetical protein